MKLFLLELLQKLSDEYYSRLGKPNEISYTDFCEMVKDNLDPEIFTDIVPYYESFYESKGGACRVGWVAYNSEVHEWWSITWLSDYYCEYQEPSVDLVKRKGQAQIFEKVDLTNDFPCVTIIM